MNAALENEDLCISTVIALRFQDLTLSHQAANALRQQVGQILPPTFPNYVYQNTGEFTPETMGVDFGNRPSPSPEQASAEDNDDEFNP